MCKCNNRLSAASDIIASIAFNCDIPFVVSVVVFPSLRNSSWVPNLYYFYD